MNVQIKKSEGDNFTPTCMLPKPSSILRITIYMKHLTKSLVFFVIIVHFMFFLLEAILWMMPAVHNILLDLLNNPVTTDYPTQALTLRNLFINQGFYNLFLMISGLSGLYFVRKEKFAVGYALILFLCFAGAGAGVVLACSTKAYLLAFFQAVPAMVAFYKIWPLFITAAEI